LYLHSLFRPPARPAVSPVKLLVINANFPHHFVDCIFQFTELVPRHILQAICGRGVQIYAHVQVTARKPPIAFKTPDCFRQCRIIDKSRYEHQSKAKHHEQRNTPSTKDRKSTWILLRGAKPACVDLLVAPWAVARAQIALVAVKFVAASAHVPLIKTGATLFALKHFLFLEVIALGFSAGDFGVHKPVARMAQLGPALAD